MVGQKVVKFRHLADWTQDVFAAKLRLTSYPVTLDIIARIETGRSSVEDKRVVAFARILEAEISRLFPISIKFRIKDST